MTTKQTIQKVRDLIRLKHFAWSNGLATLNASAWQ